MENSKIETDYKLFTAIVNSYWYGDTTINIVAKNLEEAVKIAKQYTLEHHCVLKVINNDCATIYALNETLPE